MHARKACARALYQCVFSLMLKQRVAICESAFYSIIWCGRGVVLKINLRVNFGYSSSCGAYICVLQRYNAAVDLLQRALRFCC